MVQLYASRFFMLVTACCVVLLNNSMFVAFAPIGDLVQSSFGVSLFWVNTLSWATVISDCALAVPGIWFVHRAGLRVVFLVCSGLNFAGCVIRFFAVFAGVNSTYFSLLLVGQVLGALAQPVLNSVPPQVSAEWFGDKERSVATAVISTCSLVGLGAGYALFGFLVTSIDLLWQATLVQLCLAFVFLGMSFFYKKEPPTPPSASPALKLPFRTELRTLNNLQFWFLMLMFSFPFGLFIAVWSTLGVLLGEGGYSNASNLAAIVGVVMICGGVFGATVVGIVIDRLRVRRPGIYKEMVGLCAFGTCCLFLLFHLCMRFRADNALLFASSFFAGMFSIALTPAAVECGVEMTFPVSEATSGGLLLCGANVIGTIMVLVLTLVPGVNAFLGIACGSFIVMPLLLWFKPVLMRLNEELKVMQVTDESKLLPDDAIINK